MKQQSLRTDEWFALIRNALDDDDKKRAIELCKEAAVQHPRVTNFPHVNGMLQAELGLLAEAEASYWQSLAIDPQNPDSQQRLSNLLLDQQRNDEAEALMTRWVRESPEVATLHYDIGVAASRRGDKRQALEALTEGLRLDPTLAPDAPNEYVALRNDPDFQAVIEAKEWPPNPALWYLPTQVTSGAAPLARAKTFSEESLKTFLERLRTKVREIEARDDIVLLNWDVGEPASEEAIASVEKHLGFPLDPAIRDLYRQVDGFSLRWIHRDNPVFEPEKHRRVQGRLVPGFVRKTRVAEGLDVIDNSGADDGCICLLSIREAFVDADWGDMVWFDWMTDEEKSDRDGKSYGLLSFSRSLRIFDFFSYYEMAAVVTLEQSLPVIVGTDHGADWTGPAVDFQSYWEFVLAHYGSVRARSEAFARWPPEGAVRAGARPSGLDEVLAICRRSWR